MDPESTGADGAVEAVDTATEETPAAAAAEATPAAEDEGPKSIEELEGPAPEPDAPDPEADEEGGQPAGDEDEAESGDEEDAEAAPTTREFSFGGNKLEVPIDSVPPELADKIDEFTKGTWADYTRKSQENAEAAKHIAARGQAVEKLTTINGDALQTYSRGLQLRADIEQLAAVDLNPLWHSEPDRARRISDALSAKQAEFQDIVALVGRQEQALDQAHREELTRRADEGRGILDKYVKNFSTEVAPDVVRYAISDGGMTEDEASRWAENPVLTKWAHKAMLYDRMQAAKAGKPVPPRNQVKPIKPAKGAGRAPAPNDPDKMSMEQLSKHLDIAS